MDVAGDESGAHESHPPTRSPRPGSRSARAARPADAAVRAALMMDASRHANGYPVAASLRMSTADARGSPAATFSGKLEIHLRPCTGSLSAIEAGSAMMRARPVGEAQEVRGGVDGGRLAVRPVGLLARPVTSASRSRSTWCTWLPGITANGGTVTGSRLAANRRRSPRMVGEQSARCTGSASPTSTSRGPVVGLPAVRGADVVDQQQVTGLPGLTGRCWPRRSR